VLLTLLVQGNYMNDRLTPQIITAYDTRAGAGAIAPSVEYKPDNNWVFKLGLNLKWANHKGAVEADDNRSANPFPPATCAPAIALGPDPTPCLTAIQQPGPVRLRAAGTLPLGPARHRPERRRNPVHHPLPVLIARFLTMKRLVILGAAVAGLTGIAAQAEVSDAIIKNAFAPYEKSAPTAPGYQPGMRITAKNVDALEGILDPFTFRYVKKGWLEIPTTPTFSLPQNENYIEATRKGADKVKLAPDGTLQNFDAGRPFPQEPDAKDPQAGLKLMWNFQRSINAGDSETINPFWWTFRNTKTGQSERQLALRLALPELEAPDDVRPEAGYHAEPGPDFPLHFRHRARTLRPGQYAAADLALRKRPAA
jgi:hypothetical protein